MMGRKKLMAVLLCAAMTVTALTGCAGTGDKDGTATPTAGATKAPETTGEAIPEAKYYFSFDKADGTAGIQVTSQTIGGDPILSASDKELVFVPGVKGEAVYTDGVNGIKLTEVNGVGETYTVAFWIYATRFADYMPTVQFGPDVHGDATGNQHYMNITRASWNPEGPAFPCIWSYDQAKDGLWPNWFPEEANEHLKEWMHIAISVDPSKTSIDGTTILASLYVNGALLNEEVPVVTGAMEASDNFDFLLGVNYWDKVFKGGFDELYIFDKALTAGQVLTLYQAGDPTVAFDEPEHIFVVTPNESAKEILGSLDFSNDFGDKVSEAIAIADGDTMQIKLANWSNGEDSKNNYAMLFTNKTTENPLKDAVAKVYADADGDGTFTYTWGNWKTWSQKVMKDADVTLTIERNGSVLTIQADNVDYNESKNTMYATVDVGAADDLYLYLTSKAAYVELLSVKNMTVNTTGTIIGSTDRNSPFWTVFTDIWAVPEGGSKTITFTNYTAGGTNWDNFVAILQSTATGHSTETEGYKEYAVVRADNYGWGDAFDNADDKKECNWNWDTFKSDMDGAKIVLTATNSNGLAAIEFTATTVDGTVYTQKYKNIPVDGEVYLTLTLENSYLVFEPVIVGSTDRNSPFWTVFTDIWAVPEGGSKTITFTNYTAGGTNWDNFVAILQTTATGHSTETEGYKEYAVVRADNYGWGDAFDNADDKKESNWNWDTFKSDMDGAKIVLTATNSNGLAAIEFTATTVDGTVYTQKYKNIPVDGEVYLTLTLENAYLILE